MKASSMVRTLDVCLLTMSRWSACNWAAVWAVIDPLCGSTGRTSSSRASWLTPGLAVSEISEN